MKEKKRVASFSLTEEGYQALLTLEMRTQKSRKEVVSTSLVASLGKTLEQPIVSFKLVSPDEIMFYRREVLVLETSANNLIKALFGVRPLDLDQSQQFSEIISELQDHIKDLQTIDKLLAGKQKLLKGLDAADYHIIPAIKDKKQKAIDAAKETATKEDELLYKLLKLVA
jgi:hypothetical protein